MKISPKQQSNSLLKKLYKHTHTYHLSPSLSLIQFTCKLSNDDSRFLRKYPKKCADIYARLHLQTWCYWEVTRRACTWVFFLVILQICTDSTYSLYLWPKITHLWGSWLDRKDHGTHLSCPPQSPKEVYKMNEPETLVLLPIFSLN